MRGLNSPEGLGIICGNAARPLAAALLEQSAYRAELTLGPHRGEFLICPLPDRVRSSRPRPFFSMLGTVELQETQVLGVLESRPQQPALLLHDRTLYCLALLRPARFRQAPAAAPGGSLSGVLVWAKLDIASGLHRLAALGLVPLAEGAIRAHYFGVCATLIEAEPLPVGLHACVTLTHEPGSCVPLIRSFWEHGCPFPGARDAAVAAAPHAVCGDMLTQAEDLLLAGHWQRCLELVDSCGVSYSAELEFLAGAALLTGKEPQAAFKRFHRATVLDHPYSPLLELAAMNEAARPLREEHPDLFDQIRRGDRLRALSTLRHIRHHHPLHANAILSYCLRPAKLPDEGLAACEAALAEEPDQTDVLDSKFCYLLTLQQDEEALAAAAEHLRRFPGDPRACANLLDAMLQQGDHDAAIRLAHRHLSCSTQLQHSLGQLFKAYEAAERWVELLALFELLFPLISGPTTDVLCWFGETLVENGRFEESYRVFEQAMMIAPGCAKVVLGLARALARGDREGEAAQLLASVLSDRNRVDAYVDRVFLRTMLSEIKRRTGDAAAALQELRAELGDEPVEASLQLGPFPIIELAECHLALEEAAAAVSLLQELRMFWPEDPFVENLLEIALSST